MTESTIEPPLEIRIILDDEELMPLRANPTDAGTDLRTAEDFTLSSGERRVVPTGVKVAIPTGYAGFVHPRSGLAAKHGITVVNAPGTIDADYRGEIKVILLNTSETPVDFTRGDRIAQLIVQRVELIELNVVTDLDVTERGAGGFGSTGR